MDFHNVRCGPGHGISIGSLGGGPKEEDVSGIAVRNCTFFGTENGVRIKTWARNYASSASNITFQQITMNNVRNPIIIDQQYCPSGNCKKVPISLPLILTYTTYMHKFYTKYNNGQNLFLC